MGKNLKGSIGVNNNNNKMKLRMAGPVTERLTRLEKRYSTVMVHQTYFKILDEWMQCMFGAQLFPKPNDVKVNEEEPDEDNPFYELNILAQRISSMEERLEHLGFPIPMTKFKIPAPPPSPTKSAVKRTFPTVVPTTIRRRSNYARNSAESQVVRVPVVGRKTLPVVLKSTASSPSKIIATKSSPAKSAAEETKPETEKDTGSNPVDDKSSSSNTADGESKPAGEGDLENPPDLVKDSSEIGSVVKQEDEGDEQMDEVDGNNAAGVTNAQVEDNEQVLEEMEVDEPDYEDYEEDFDDEEEEEEEEEIELKPIVPTPEELAAASASSGSGGGGGGTVGRPRGPRGSKNNTSNNTPTDVVTIEDDQPVVTYTTRGRRHTLPRRYAEFTGHDNVASILKSQQRAANNAAKIKTKKKVAKTEKPAAPSKPPKAPSTPKSSTPKKQPADGTRPECVYQLIGTVQGKEVDEAGDVVLWDAYPDVKVNLNQLISVIFRSSGMSTRLTRKMTTLVFEDQVLANASPFGTKYYQERLPPERLESMVEFIAASGFDPEYTKKKIYMIVGQVCNEARAGRVRKLLPTTGPSGEEQAE